MGQPVQRSSATADIPPRPLAAVVPLPRKPRGQTDRTDIVVVRRQRLVAEMGELVRVVAVAMLAAAADRLIGVIARPAVSPAHGGKFERSRNDALDITASIVPGAPSHPRLRRGRRRVDQGDHRIMTQVQTATVAEVPVTAGSAHEPVATPVTPGQQLKASLRELLAVALDRVAGFAMDKVDKASHSLEKFAVEGGPKIGALFGGIEAKLAGNNLVWGAVRALSDH